ncbi:MULTISPECIES: hypothetical protein [Nostocales]|uniref:Uncharacterized protein n=3 Tax=Nostocales TaxID=1161 RepID=A0A0C1MZ38_9CYAN|nr:hypothetical protein [Tolypothrix bouteillei]KAF3888919.1 hypothetical protein DA73_0400028120 [Tolypothrix bouteillei VB521301]
MIISDLSHLDILSEDDAILGSAGATVSTNATASGDYTQTKAVTKSFALPLGNNGSLAIGIGYAQASAVDSQDASAVTSVSGSANGDINFVIGKNYSTDNGPRARAGGVVLAVGIDIPG